LRLWFEFIFLHSRSHQPQTNHKYMKKRLGNAQTDPKTRLRKKHMESDCKFCFRLPWNGLRYPFRKKLKFCTKRNMNSVSHNRETDSVIRFRKKFAIFFMKRITESVSQFCETEFVFHFLQNIKFFLNGLCNPFPKCVKRISYSVP